MERTAQTSARRRWPLYIAIVVVLDIMLVAGALGVAVRAPLQIVRVAAGPEDQNFLSNKRVQAEFARNGLDVVPSPLDSGDMVTPRNLRNRDAVIPANSFFADEIQQELSYGVHRVSPFRTQLVVLTWSNLIPLLKKLGIADPSGTFFNLAQSLKIASEGITWDSIPGNNAYRSPDPVRLETTDPRYSGSGAAFVADTSWVLNGDKMVTAGEADRIAAEIAGSLSGEGEPPGTSGLFNHYVSGGPDGVPLALSYESYFLGDELTPSAGGLPAGAKMLYLNPAIECDPTIVPLTSAGQKFADLTQHDTTLQSIAENYYGFRTTSSGVAFAQVMAKHRINVPRDFPINQPATGILADLINAIEPQHSS